MQRNIKLIVEYDGTPYAGWQFQNHQDTVQARLMQAIHKVTGSSPTLSVAGRTDAGVHALGQVASFRTTSPIELFRLPLALNANLPPTIAVRACEEMPLEFDARHASRAKRYLYRVFNNTTRSPSETPRAWHIREPLDLDAMREGAAALIGELDFESFRSAHCDSSHARRKMFGITISAEARFPSGRLVSIEYHANAFCRHMCRILTGTLVEVGMGKRDAASVGITLAARDRTAAGVTAPPHGLTLMQVEY